MVPIFTFYELVDNDILSLEPSPRMISVCQFLDLGLRLNEKAILDTR